MNRQNAKQKQSKAKQSEREQEERRKTRRTNEKTSKDAYNTLISEDSASVACSFFYRLTHTHTHIETLRVRVIHFKFNWLTTHTHTHSLARSPKRRYTNQPTSIWFIEKVETVSAVRCSPFTFNLELRNGVEASDVCCELNERYLYIEYMHTNIRVNTCTHVRSDGWTECAQNLGARKNISTKRWCL